MQEFTAKRNALFACLDDASKDLKGTALDQSHMQNNVALERRLDDTLVSKEDTNLRRNERNAAVDQSLKRMRGKESLFKKPELPIGRCLKPRKTPDYQINPHKWKKYSLSDVDISEHTNTAAAFAFLKEMDEKRETAAEAAGDGGEATDARYNKEHKIEFKKSSQIKRNLHKCETTEELLDAEVDKPHLRGSKMIMPEYVIGQKQRDKKSKNKEAAGKSTRAAGTLKLSHLAAADDDDEDNEDNDNFEEESVGT